METNKLEILLKVREELLEKSKMGQIHVEANGHFRGMNWSHFIDRVISDSILWNPNEIENVLEGREAHIRVGYDYLKCGDCGESLEWFFKGDHFFCKGERCSCETREYSVEINIPSGCIIFGNDPRGTFPLPSGHEVNQFIGRVKTSRDYEKIGVAHFSILNSCPSVCIDPNGELVVGSFWRSDRDGLLEGYRSLGGIITDLWWFYAVDSDYFKLHGAKDENIIRVNVKPGVYKFTHLFEEKNLDGSWNEDGVFTRIQFLRGPEPVRDLYQGINDIDLTPERVISKMMNDWPSLYPSVQRCVDHILLVLGGGEWHKKGFIYYSLDDLYWDHSVEIPEFNRSYNWYPFSSHSTLSEIAHGKIDANIGFQKLALDVSACITKYGISSSDSGEDNSASLLEMKDCLRLLIGRFPDVATDYHREVLNEGVSN